MWSQKILPEEIAGVGGLEWGWGRGGEWAGGRKALQPGGTSKSKKKIQEDGNDKWTTVVKA